jgi:hypothetical protein
LSDDRNFAKSHNGKFDVSAAGNGTDQSLCADSFSAKFSSDGGWCRNTQSFRRIPNPADR